MIHNRKGHTVTRIIDLTSTPVDIIVKMADGNPGAARVMADMFNSAPKIDPSNVLGGYGPVLFLDTLGIYGHRVWMLYKDVCGEDLTKTLAALRAVQMGIASRSSLVSAIDGKSSFNADEALKSVKSKLPAFANASP